MIFCQRKNSTRGLFNKNYFHPNDIVNYNTSENKVNIIRKCVELRLK